MKLVLFICILDYIICLIAFVVQINYPDDSLEYFMSVDYSRSIRIVFWAIGFYLLIDMKIHKEFIKIAHFLIAFCVVIFILDFVKNILAYEDIIIWKEWFTLKRIVHTFVLFLVSIKVKDLHKKLNFINN